MKKRIYILSLGCPRNLVDSEILTGTLKEEGCLIAEDPRKADILIINTCGFIESAKKESIDSILELAAFKGQGRKGEKKLIVTGCLSQRYSGELKKEIPEVDAVFGSSDFLKISDYIKRSGNAPDIQVSKRPNFIYSHRSGRALITPHPFAYVKLQEGCMNHCSYCIIPRLRGKFRSRPISSVISEIKKLKDNLNIKEVNLIGQDTTLYGIDRYGRPEISSLVNKAARIMKGGWVRLLYAHPAHFTDGLLSAVKNNDNVCNYIDLPIQHINDRILKKMNRKVTKEQIIGIIEKLRKNIPGIAIRTSVMVGFPGETDKEFKELVEFLKDIRFERLGAFTYSREEGTPAYNYPGQISEKEKNLRYDELLKVQQRISHENNEKLFGSVLTVLVEKNVEKENSMYIARTYMDAPEVDGICYVTSRKKPRPGDFVKVKITDTLEYDIAGEAI